MAETGHEQKFPDDGFQVGSPSCKALNHQTIDWTLGTTVLPSA